LATKSLQLDLRGELHLGMLRWLCDPRRNQVAPSIRRLVLSQNLILPPNGWV